MLGLERLKGVFDSFVKVDAVNIIIYLLISFLSHLTGILIDAAVCIDLFKYTRLFMQQLLALIHSATIANSKPVDLKIQKKKLPLW